MKIIVESAAKSMIFSSDMHGKILIYWRCPHGKEWLAIGEHGEIFIPGQRGGGEPGYPEFQTQLAVKWRWDVENPWIWSWSLPKLWETPRWKKQKTHRGWWAHDFVWSFQPLWRPLLMGFAFGDWLGHHGQPNGWNGWGEPAGAFNQCPRTSNLERWVI